MKTLYCGDPHYKESQKDEMERLMAFVLRTSRTEKVDNIVLLGDLNDTFGVLRTGNLAFWEKWLDILSEWTKLIVLVGNHDKKNQGNDDDKENSLSIFNLINNAGLSIIQSPVVIGQFAYMPYIHDKKRFVEEANQLASQGAKVLVCHGEFDGAAYDNGFYIKDGIKQEELNFDLVISGHIHTRAKIGKIRYPGAPRWMTASDANKEKGLWLVEHDDKTGTILQESFLDTSNVCTPIYAYQYKEGEAEPQIPEGSRASVELVGSSEWVSKQKLKFKGKAAVSSKITDKSRPENRKTGNSLAHFINNVFEVSTGLERDEMIDFMKELGVL